MTKRWLSALEKVFVAEVEGRLPFQSKARVFVELEQDGMLAPMSRVFGSGWSAMTENGWELTHRGRIAYCESCPDVDDQDP